MDALINFTGGGVNFRASRNTNDTISSGQRIPYNTIVYDSEGTAYDNTNYSYTVVISGTYVFTLGWGAVGETAVVNLIVNRGGTETIIQQSTNGTVTSSNTYFVLTTIYEVLTGDVVYAYIESGSLRLGQSNTNTPNTQTSFSGSRISN